MSRRDAPARRPIRRPLRGAAALALALGLAACGTPEPPRYGYGPGTPDFGRADRAPRVARSESSAPARVEPGMSARKPAESAPDRRLPAAAAAAPIPPEPRADRSRQAALPPREPPPEPPRLEELRGLTTGQLTLILGKPSLARQDGTAQMWQYRSESCVLYVFLYPERDQARVHHVETRARQTGAPALTAGPSECLATLIGARRAQS